MNSNLDKVRFYQLALELWDECWGDTNAMLRDVRGKEVARQLVRAIGSISANIEEGYGRGLGKQYPHFLKISRGSSQESKGWYKKSKFLLSDEIIQDRIKKLDAIINMETKTIQTLENK